VEPVWTTLLQPKHSVLRQQQEALQCWSMVLRRSRQVLQPKEPILLLSRWEGMPNYHNHQLDQSSRQTLLLCGRTSRQLHCSLSLDVRHQVLQQSSKSSASPELQFFFSPLLTLFASRTLLAMETKPSADTDWGFVALVATTSPEAIAQILRLSAPAPNGSVQKPGDAITPTLNSVVLLKRRSV